MIYDVYRSTVSSVKGWFPFGLPIPARVVTVLEMSAYREMDARVEEHLVSLNNRARGLNLSRGTSDELYAASLLFNVYRYLLGVWSGEGVNAEKRLNEFRRRVGEVDFSDAKNRFCRVYPSAPNKETPTRFVVETILLRMCKSNPALALFRNLFIEPFPTDASDAPVTFAGPAVSNFESVIEDDVYFQRIMEAVSEAPDDLKAQLRHTVSRWRHDLPATFVDPILRAIDVLNEVHTLRGAPGVVVHTEPLVFDDHRSGLTEITAERFTPDRDWMSNVVLIAKQTYVWLFQLSEQYGRDIRRLDEIPDEELDRLAALGFTGLWLIGLWRRSRASETIKRRMGNPDAIASAYALDDYEIAQELGGVPAYEVLAEKANKRGIRLAADMVPNHVGIDGQWVKHHPERFISTHQLPYENYRFEGPDLCEDAHLSIYLEDGYYSQTDAAVVFKRVDHTSGDVRYIYHGNDGTQMPWNDTAQLDYLNADVREEVIQMILSVARRFPIIRFDAAMTLAKRHIQRLWYPQPGGGGAIPSRSKFGGCSSEDFERAIPKEFWREVVDRINDELPDTLLLAEAFWMMEGYFVRNLGMHRVYNSAFMNMLKREHNSDYRTTIKNTLAFSPEILKRFVNFMNNPDEETAVAQFGRGDKYLGNAILMATMPGLPMFGHGQVEGYEEKYGMEYQRPQLTEHVDEHLVWMHKRYIAPLLHDRHLFAETTFFHLYDFEPHPGVTNENVFAYSNRCGDERVLVLYNNSYDSTRGQVALSVEWNSGSAEAPILQRCSLLDGLGYANDEEGYYRCLNVMSGNEYLFRKSDLNLGGMYFELAGYQTMVLRGFRRVDGPADELEAIRQSMSAAGIDSIDRRRCHHKLGSLYSEWQAFVASIDVGEPMPGALKAIACDARATALFAGHKRVEQIENVLETVASTANQTVNHPSATDPDSNRNDDAVVLDHLRKQEDVERQLKEPDTQADFVARLARIGLLYATLSDDGKAMIGDSILSLVESSEALVIEGIAAIVDAEALTINLLFEAKAVRDALGVHRHKSVSWFRKENSEQFLSVLYVIDALGFLVNVELPVKSKLELLIEQSGYRYEDFLFLVQRSIGTVDGATKSTT